MSVDKLGDERSYDKPEQFQTASATQRTSAAGSACKYTIYRIWFLKMVIAQAMATQSNSSCWPCIEIQRSEGLAGRRCILTVGFFSFSFSFICLYLLSFFQLLVYLIKTPGVLEISLP